MSWMFHIFAGIALIVLASGLVRWGNIYMEGKQAQMKGHAQHRTGDKDELSVRLEELEARMRDVLDVMIALSEKMDRWERDGVRSREATTG